ncbi:MAG: hypothetical protein ACREID_09715 [Planctomycetota bacterium]
MRGYRALAFCLLAAAAAGGDDTTTTAEPPVPPPGVKKALNRAFRGRVTKIKKKRVTLYYDFEDPAQLEDFEAARPPRLLDASQNQVRVEGGRLVLEGSSAVRHRMEGTGELRARFYARLSEKRNFGTVFTEPVLSDFYVVLNLFDHRFYEDGGLLLASCGLHEDEGADVDMSLVNWRDIFKSNVDGKVKIGQDVEIESAKNGWEESCRVADVEGKGSSKGKCKEMRTYQFGLWVHQSRATVDDLTVSLELTDEFLHLNDLKAELEADWEEVATSGPLAGIKGIPPRTRTDIEEYAAGRGEASRAIQAMLSAALPQKARETACKALCDRGDPKTVPLVIDGLYNEDKTARELSIRVVKKIVGKDFGYGPSGPEKARSKAIQALNEHLAQDRTRYYG